MSARQALLSVVLPALLSAPLMAQDLRPPTAPWQDQVHAAIAEHEASWRIADGAEVTTVHRAQGLRASLSGDRLALMPRDPTADPWLASVQTSAWGRGGTRAPLPAGDVDSDGRLANLRREGLREWFVNGFDGIEQGWTLATPPPVDDTGPLQLELTFVGLSPRIAEDGLSALLVDALGEPRLHYHGLAAWDASGRALDARLVANGSTTLVEVDDTGARYPVTIDPVIGGVAWAFDGDQVDAWLGWAVASAGDVNGDGYDDVIIGVPQYDTLVTDGGAAFVFHGSAGGLSTVPAWIEEYDGEADAQFGAAVASAGDVNDDGYDDVIVGAPYRDGLATDTGVVWVWHGSPSGLGGSPDWSALALVDSAEFGLAVGGLGDVNDDGFDDIGVGAPGVEAAYGWFGGPFGLGPNGLPANADWIGSGFGFGDYGADLNGAGDVNDDGYDDVIVGERKERSAHVHFGGPLGPSPTPDWTKTDHQSGSFFGVSVDGAGDVNGDGYDDVIVGAWEVDDKFFDEGMVFVFQGSATGLSSGAADWAAGSEQAGALLGRSVAGAGDVNGDGFDDVVAGAISWDDDQADEGGAFLWLGSSVGLASDPVWVGTSNQTGSQYGLEVQSAGDVNGDGYDDVVVGAPQFADGETDEGRVYLHLGSPGGVAPVLGSIADSDVTNSEFGRALALGDVNGDGYDDLAVGAIAYDGGHMNEGLVIVFMGTPDGTSASNLWFAECDATEAALGASVAMADVDGDGYDDLLAGAPFMDGASAETGRVFLWKGSPVGLGPDGTVANADWSVEGATAEDWLGSAVAGVDVDNDGDDDVLVGAYGWDGVLPNEGAALLYTSDGSLPGATPSWTAVGNESGCEMGVALANAGDVNADGYEDVAVGLPKSDLFGGGLPWVGRVRVYHGSAAGLSTTIAWHGDGSQAGAYFGRALSGVGDVDGDGYDDLVVGAPGLDVVTGASPYGQGRALLFYGSAAGLTPAGGNPINAPWQVMVNGQSASSGWSVGGGDVNGDGYADVLVGAPGASMGLVFTGSPDGPHLAAEWVASAPGLDLGTSIGAGDVNGDGLDDVAIGSPLDSAGQPNEGTVRVYFGSLKGPWFDLGNAKPGLRGEPRLLGFGDLTGGSTAQVSLLNAREWQNVYLILGFSTVYAPAKGGVLVPALDFIFDPFPAFEPAVTLETVWPVGLPKGSPVYFQAWITDDTALKGFSASNGLGATLP
jgi:hypothetical protein